MSIPAQRSLSISSSTLAKVGQFEPSGTVLQRSSTRHTGAHQGIHRPSHAPTEGAHELANKGGFLRIFEVARLSMSLSTDRPGVGGELPEKDLCLVVVQCFDGFQQLHLQHHTNDDRSIHAYLLTLRVRGHIIGHTRKNM